jgi:hypothetical protein
MSPVGPTLIEEYEIRECTKHLVVNPSQAGERFGKHSIQDCSSTSIQSPIGGEF